MTPSWDPLYEQLARPKDAMPAEEWAKKSETSVLILAVCQYYVGPSGLNAYKHHEAEAAASELNRRFPKAF